MGLDVEPPLEGLVPFCCLFGQSNRHVGCAEIVSHALHCWLQGVSFQHRKGSVCDPPLCSVASHLTRIPSISHPWQHAIQQAYWPSLFRRQEISCKVLRRRHPWRCFIWKSFLPLRESFLWRTCLLLKAKHRRDVLCERRPDVTGNAWQTLTETRFSQHAAMPKNMLQPSFHLTKLSLRAAFLILMDTGITIYESISLQGHLNCSEEGSTKRMSSFAKNGDVLAAVEPAWWHHKISRQVLARLHRTACWHQEALLASCKMCPTLTSLHRYVSGRMNVGRDAQRNAISEITFSVRPGRFGCPGGISKLEKLVQRWLVRVDFGSLPITLPTFFCRKQAEGCQKVVALV